MRRAFLYIVIFLQVLILGQVRAQSGTVFPVDLNVTLTPPYGPCLDDYVGIGGNRFLCNVLFRDQMKDKTSPVFEYVIEMKVQTMGGSTVIKAWSEDHKAVLGAVEHFDGGRLMREFLSETNRTGGSTCLKEGPYTMTFRVYDAISYNRGRGKGIPISQEFSFSVFVDKGAAPELFNPSDKERLSTTTQMVNFQWQLPYVASGMNTYKFVLARIPQGGNANTDIDNPSYQIRSESVGFPMVQVPVTTLFGYDAQGDGSYAWQVTVCDAEGNQRANYENRGKSKVFTFTFNDEVWLPDSFVTVAPFVKSINKNLDKLSIDSVEVDNETGSARWTNANLGDAGSYHGSIIEVRKKGQDKWTPYISEELKSGDDEQQLPNLKKGVEYEARGQYYQTDNGDTVYAPYGEIVPFTVPSDIDTMNCADGLPALTDCGDAQPKEIHPGDTIIANGKRVFVDSVTYNGDRLSGSGHLDFPIIKCFKFRMHFKDIKVNCAGELVDGEITSVYDPTNAFILDLNNLTGKGNSGNETFNSTEPTVDKVKDLNDAKTSKLPGDYFEVEGEPNTIYSLDKDKNPVKIGTKLANWTSDTFTHANKMYNSEILLKFSNDRRNQGFDSSEEPYRLMAPSKYESVDGYWVPWLASNPGRECVVKAKLEGKSISNVKDPEHDVKFIMPLSDGGLMELNTQYKAGSGEFEISVMGSSKAGDKLEIYAVIKKTDGKNEEYVDAGRLYVPIYEYRTLKMTIVKVNGANSNAVDKSSVESYLNEVYGRIGITFEVTEEDFQSEEAKAFLEDGLDVCGAGGFMTATTDEMRQLKRLYMASKGGSVDEKRLYLFLVNKAQCTGEDSKIDPSAVCGDMPRNSKVGYLFAENAGDQASFNRTIAHELGHGAFAYEHPFDNAAYKTEQGATRNLMDYVTDDDLAYFQWQSTLGLNLTWGFLEGDEDGMGLFDWYHWIPVDKDEFWDDDLKDLVNDYEDEMEFIIKNRSTWVNLSEKKNLEEYPKWTVVKDGKISEKWLSVKENETTTLKDYKANHIYAYANTVITETKKEKTYSGDESPARFTYFFIYVFKDAPKLTNYRIKDFSELENNQRVRAFYYGNKYGAIAFFSESGELQAIMQFDYSESNATSEMKKSMTEDWVTSLLGGGNVDKNETPTQALGHYIVTDENALVRDKDDRSKSTGVKIPYGTEVIIDTSKGEEKIKSSIIVYVKLADSGDEYYTSKSNLTEIVIVNNEVKKLPYSVKSLKLPYAIESTGITHTKDLECTIIAKCGDYYRITSPELKEFGTSENSKGYWCYDWKTKNRLTPFEISLVRPEIEKITNVKDRGDDFQKLQEKVPYHNQRDNNNTTKISDGMCNLTSIAMAYEMLGIGRDSVVKIVESKNDISLPDSIKNGQFEDLLEHLRKEKNYGGRTAYKTWDDIADYLDIKYKTYWISSSQKNNAKINELNDSLRHGCGVIVSLFNWKGHIVRMQAIGENGMTIDDPFGKLKRMTIRDIDCNISSGSYNGNDRNLSDNGKKGEDNILTWEEFDVKNSSTGGKDGAEVEIEGKTILTDQSTVTNQVTFETWWNSSSRVGKSEYLTRTTSETKNGKTINKTYYKTKGAVIKIYKVYYK